MTATHRDAAYRSQPSLFDATFNATASDVRPAVPNADQGVASRNATYSAVVDKHAGDRSVWLDRVRIAGRRGITLDELSALYHTPANAISGRITELARAGKVIRTKDRRPTRAWTPERKITAAVIVAAEHHHATNTTDQTTTDQAPPMTPPAKDILPDQDTTAGTPRDQHGDPVRAGCTYMVSAPGRSARRVQVFDADCQDFVQEVFSDGRPVGGSRPQRIGSVDPAAAWQLIKR